MNGTYWLWESCTLIVCSAFDICIFYCCLLSWSDSTEKTLPVSCLENKGLAASILGGGIHEHPVYTTSSSPLLFQHGIPPQPEIPNPEILAITIFRNRPQLSAGVGKGQLYTCTDLGKGPRNQSSWFSTRSPYPTSSNTLCHESWASWGMRGEETVVSFPLFASTLLSPGLLSIAFQFPNFCCCCLRSSPSLFIFVGFWLLKKSLYSRCSGVFKKSKMNCVGSVHRIYLEVSISISPLNWWT